MMDAVAFKHLYAWLPSFFEDADEALEFADWVGRAIVNGERVGERGWPEAARYWRRFVVAS